MDCIFGIDPNRSRLNARPVSAAFRLAVIEQAVAFLSRNLSENSPALAGELQAACHDAAEALAELKAGMNRTQVIRVTE